MASVINDYLQNNHFAVLSDDYKAPAEEQLQLPKPPAVPLTNQLLQDGKMTATKAAAHHQPSDPAKNIKPQPVQANRTHQNQNPTSSFIRQRVMIYNGPKDPTMRTTVIDIYLEAEEVLESGLSYSTVQLVHRNFPLAGLAPASKFVRDQLKGIPQCTYGGKRLVRELYIPANEVSEDALKIMLKYIHDSYLPFASGYDPNETPQITFEDGDIKSMCDMYQVYVLLGMHEGQLQYQGTLVDAIKVYFAPNRKTKAEEVLYFWRACKEDVVLTWRVMKQVLSCVQKCGLEFEAAFGRYFEQETELRHLWEVISIHK